eukprot:6195773-Pleurochrysis_carterae.AAC.2
MVARPWTMRVNTNGLTFFAHVKWLVRAYSAFGLLYAGNSCAGPHLRSQASRVVSKIGLKHTSKASSVVCACPMLAVNNGPQGMPRGCTCAYLE